MTDKVLAWHWLRDDKTLGYSDGRMVWVGETLSIPEGHTLELCNGGMHASAGHETE